MTGARSGDGPETIVVGAGVAGCVVAGRLVEAGHSVTVVEAGPGEPRPASILGLDTVAAAEEPARQWPGLAVRTLGGEDPVGYRQGFGIGGGSAVNSLILSPGDRADYDRWSERFGCQDWDAEEMAPWIDRATRSWPVTVLEPGPITAAFCSAAAGAGHPVGGRTLEQDRLGVLEACLAAQNGRRQSAYDRYLAPMLTESDGIGRLQVVTDRPVRRVTVGDRRAAGVELVDGTHLAADRVILSAGAVQSPRILVASGLSDRPVGDRLLDHPSFAVTIKLRPSVAAVAGPRDRTVSRVLRWSSAEPPAEELATGQAGIGDLQAFVLDRVDDGRGPDSYAVVVVGLMSVSSAGLVGDASAPPVLGTLGTPGDRGRLRNGVRHVLELLERPEFADIAEEVFVDDRGTPASMLRSLPDDAFDRWLIEHPGPYAHPAGSCPMDRPRGRRRWSRICRPTEAWFTVRPGFTSSTARSCPTWCGVGYSFR